MFSTDADSDLVRRTFGPQGMAMPECGVHGDGTAQEGRSNGKAAKGAQEGSRGPPGGGTRSHQDARRKDFGRFSTKMYPTYLTFWTVWEMTFCEISIFWLVCSVSMNENYVRK